MYDTQPANLTTTPEFCSQLCVKVLQAPPLAPDSPIYMALSPPTPGTPQAFYAAYFSSAPAAQAFTPALQAPHTHASSAQWPQVRNNPWRSHVVSFHPLLPALQLRTPVHRHSSGRRFAQMDLHLL